MDDKIIKITDTQAMQVSHFKDPKGAAFVKVSKLYRKKGETKKSDWKHTRQFVTIPEAVFTDVRKAMKTFYDALEEAPTWTPQKDEN